VKVLILAPTLKSLGGIQRYVLTLICALEDLFGKEHIRLVTLNLSDDARDAASSGGVPTTAKLRFVVASLREAAVWRPDLIICAHVGIAPLGKLLRVLGIAPYWVMAYGIDVWAQLRARDHRGLVGADRVVTISEFTRTQVVRLQGVRPERTCLLPPCLDAEWMAEASSYSIIPRQQRRPTLLTVSRLSSAERYKGHDVVLQALVQVCREIPGALYVIVGDGDDRPRLETLSRQLGLTDAVRFEGAAPVETLKACYRDCDIFVMPARTVLDQSAPKGEGFGIVFLEAMAYGKPVIGPASGAPSEFIHHGEHGILVNPEDEQEVASALIELLASPQRACEMGAAARDWVQREYSYARFGERLRRLFAGASPKDLRKPQCAS
jgi:glycosyltransferase involved in cell wall biosynthesis